MPLVFVHGVSVRAGDQYDRDVALRDSQFANVMFAMLGLSPEPAAILNPYWGDLVATPTAWRSLKTGNGQRPSAREVVIERLRARMKAASTPFSMLHLARTHSMSEMVDLMYLLAVEEEITGKEQSVDHQALSRMALRLVRLTSKFRHPEEKDKWLSRFDSDEQLFDQLERDIQDDGAQPGISHKLTLAHFRKAAHRWREGAHIAAQRVTAPMRALRGRARMRIKQIRQAGRRTATFIAARSITNPARGLFHDKLSMFVGDSFNYFGKRGDKRSPGPIAARVIESIETAERLRKPDCDPHLIVVAHSMGGNIICDVVSDFDLKARIDVLVTVGSQFPLFADLNLFPGLDNSVRPIPKPESVGTWINVLDPNDMLAYAAEPIFSGIKDTHVASGRLGVATHTDYFLWLSFYETMARAIHASGAIKASGLKS